MTRNELTMYHESGHAVIAHVLGLSVEEISAIPGDDSDGHMRGVAGEKEWVARAAVFGTDPDLVRRYILTVAAGPAAKCIAAHGLVRSRPFPWTLWGGENDRQVAEMLLGAARGLDDDLDDIMEEAIDLLQDPAVWAAVQRVVRELRHFGGEIDHELFIGAFMGLVPLR